MSADDLSQFADGDSFFSNAPFPYERTSVADTLIYVVLCRNGDSAAGAEQLPNLLFRSCP